MIWRNVPRWCEFCTLQAFIWSALTMRPRHSSRNLLCLPVWFSFLKSLSALGDNSLLFFLSGFDRGLAFPFQEAGGGKKEKKSPYNAGRQTAASAASLSGPAGGLWGSVWFTNQRLPPCLCWCDLGCGLKARQWNGMECQNSSGA